MGLNLLLTMNLSRMLIIVLPTPDLRIPCINSLSINGLAYEIPGV
jgi:hypothetical protein